MYESKLCKIQLQRYSSNIFVPDHCVLNSHTKMSIKYAFYFTPSSLF
jgi:hypothetical protein